MIIDTYTRQLGHIDDVAFFYTLFYALVNILPCEKRDRKREMSMEEHLAKIIIIEDEKNIRKDLVKTIRKMRE